MNVRFYSMVMNGDLKLPCRGKMVEVALEDKVRPKKTKTQSERNAPAVQTARM